MTKRIFAAVIAIAMVCTMFAFASSAAETTTVQLDASVTSYGWDQIINALNFNDIDHNEDGWSKENIPEAANVNAMLLYCYKQLGWGPGNENIPKILYTFPVNNLIDAGITWVGDRPAADVRFCDYFQNTFGAVAYALRGGKQKAVDLWNSYVPAQPIALLGDNAYTVTGNTLYTTESYDAALNALSAYMTYAQDNQVCNILASGRWTAQKARYAALETALQGLVEGTPDTPVLPPETPTDPTLVDMTGLTSPDFTTQLLINFYNNVDVESYRAKEVVQTWAAALKEGVEAGLAYDAILVGDVDVCTLWESTIRFEVFLAEGARRAADNIMNDVSLWPLGTVIADPAQTTYKAAQYQEVYDLWVRIRDEYKASTTVKTSEVIAACDELKAKIQALEVATLPFTSEQKQAAMAIFDKNYSAYGPAIGMSALEIYQQRLNRVVLDVNKATDTYINYKALIDTAAAWAALDWVNGTSESYPTLAEIQALLTFDAEGWIVGGTLEDDWYPFRKAFGLDNAGYDAVVAAAVAEWEASGLYTDASIAAVKASLAKNEVATMTGARGSNNTDEQTQGDIVIYKAMLEEKPALPEFKVSSANLTLSDSIAVNFRVKKDVYEAYENVYAVITCGNTTVTVDNPTYKADEELYAFTFAGIGPQMMKDTINFTLYGTANGQQYTKSVEYSVYRYCTNQLAKTTKEGFKTVLTDLLNYGAAAQVYANYKTDDLANAGVDQTYATATLATAPEKQLNLEYATIDNPTVAWKSAALYLESKVNVKLEIETDDLTGLTVKFVIDGAEYDYDKFEAREGREGRYYVYFDNILPTQMRTLFTATVYRDGVAVSNTLQYSIQTYVYGKTTEGVAVNDMLVAMLKYADACKAYFG